MYETRYAAHAAVTLRRDQCASHLIDLTTHGVHHGFSQIWREGSSRRKVTGNEVCPRSSFYARIRSIEPQASA